MTSNEYPQVKAPSAYWDGKPEDYKNKQPGILENYFSASSTANTALRFIDKTRERLNNYNDVIKKNFQNPTNTPQGAKMLNREFGKKVWERTEKESDKILGSLQSEIQSINNRVNREITTEASSRDAAEIRQHIKSLDDTERISFIQDRINAEDWETVSAALGKKHLMRRANSL